MSLPHLVGVKLDEDSDNDHRDTNDEHGVPKGEKADMDESVKKQ